MKSIAKFSVLLLMVAFFATACGKYEEGPKLSLASKKARIVNTWVVYEITENNVVQTLSEEDKNSTVEFKKDNTVVSTYENVSFTAKWELSDDKESIIITNTFDNVTFTTNYKILKLKSNEMWLEEKDDNDVIVTKLESK